MAIVQGTCRQTFPSGKMRGAMAIKATAIMFLLLAAGSATAECRAIGAGPVAVVELYTSEGCSSCPPADRWLSGLGRTAAPLRVIPLALHVPYWDYIGWQDRFASPRFEERQRRAARLSGSGVVYTPQVVLNGRDFRGWNGAAFGAALEGLAGQSFDASLNLAARFSRGAIDGSLSARGPAGARVVLVRFENGLESQVGAGENAGRRLSHDYVARDWLELGVLDTTGRLEAHPTLPARADARPERTGVVALLEDPASGRILQAVALPYCPPS
jgi:hypothetical protein